MAECADLNEAIWSQPEWLARADEIATGVLAERPLTSWLDGGTVAIIGMGAASHAATAFVEELRRAGVRAVNLDASAARDYPVAAMADRFVVISESGKSPEPLAVAKQLPVGQRFLVTNHPTGPLAQYADVVIPLGGFVDSGVYTIGHTTSLVALAHLAAAGGVDVGDPASFAAVAARALAVAEPQAQRLAEQADAFSSIDIVGQGASYGSAVAIALLIREATGLASAAYETYQYLHGPMESAKPSTGTLIFGTEREATLAAQLQASGVGVLRFVADAGVTDTDTCYLGTPTSGLATTVADVVFSQVVVAALTRRRGLTPGAWRFPQPDTKTD